MKIFSAIILSNLILFFLVSCDDYNRNPPSLDISKQQVVTVPIDSTAKSSKEKIPYYSNGPKMKILRAEAVRIDDDKVLSAVNIKNGWVEIDNDKKIISIFNTPNNVDKYHYYEFNKNIKLKGRLIDTYSISKTETADGKPGNVDVLVFKKRGNSDYLSSIYMMGKTSAYALRF